MKSTEILKTINKNKKQMQANEDKILAFYMKDERRAAASAGKIEELHALRAEVKANEEDIRKLSNKNELLKIENSLLYDLMLQAVIDEALPHIENAIQKYNGKQYGERTREKIYEEVKKAGFSIWFSGYTTKTTIEINVLTPDGYTNREIPAAEIHTKYSAPFITEENTINYNSATTYTYYKKVENVKQAARDIKKAIEASRKAAEKAKEAKSALDALLPTKAKYNENFNEFCVKA